MSQDEQDNEFRLLKEWGILTDKQAEEKGIAWPDDPQAKGGFKDTWSWHEDIHPDWIASIKITHPAVNMLLETTRHIHGDSISAYLAFMAIRLFEIHRILKPTGSLYLHCDHTASGYLRQLIDGVFSKDNFRNEISWCYPPTGRPPKHGYPRKHDTILYYSKGETPTWNQPYTEMTAATRKAYSSIDEDGRYYSKAHGGKTYLDEVKGRAVPDWWTDIGSGSHMNKKERTGYPTQKPMALAERIIKASTNPGDVILDCFAGCAYVALAAEKIAAEDPSQARSWSACDINPRAWTVFKRQFNKGGKMPILTCADTTTGQQVMSSEPTVTLHGPDQLPNLKTSREVEIKPLITPSPQAPKPKAETTLMSRHEMLIRLLALSNGRTWCCGLIHEGTNGQLIYTNYELDHIVPKSKGGEDEIINRAPLCKAHNILKSDKDLTIEQLRTEVAWIGEIAKDWTPSRLIKMDFALDQARKIYAEVYEKRKGRPLPFQPPVEAV